MKRKMILTMIVVVCVGVVANVVYLLNEIFPSAGEMRRPEIEEVVSVQLGCNTSDELLPVSEQCYQELSRYLIEAKPTRKQSLNDCPTSRPYYEVEIQTRERCYYYFVYEEGEQVYIEIPYEGIYESKIELLELVLNYLEKICQ